MIAPGEFLCGVIEGYYGRTWPFDTRLAYADYLAQAGAQYLYLLPQSGPIPAQALAGSLANASVATTHAAFGCVSNTRHPLGCRPVSF